MLCRSLFIGGTPLLALDRLSSALNLRARLFAKLEMFNPTGSSKDRAALAMLGRAEEEGRLASGILVCATSGNMGISLAALSAARGYRLIAVMPQSMSRERQDLLRAYGAEIVLTAGGMGEAEQTARTIAERTGGALMEQFSDPSNPAAHYRTTGPEIWKETGGCADFFVAGVGSGGTISGAGRYLKEKNPHCRVIAVEPAASPVLSGGKPAPHPLQGIGAGFVPATLDRSVIDGVIPVTGEEAFGSSRLLAKKEGILAGISSGAALHAAAKIAAREEGNVVVLLPDGGERYFSAGLFGSD